MKKIFKPLISILLLLVISLVLYFNPIQDKNTDSNPDSTPVLEETPSSSPEESEPVPQEPNSMDESVHEEGTYTSKWDVALYIHTYNHLPDNFITKKEAEALGWDNKKGNLNEVAVGKSIGGDHFGNYENLLPSKENRRWTECDINYSDGYRNGERMIFSNDGLVFYTDDHYKTFEQLY